MYWAGRAADFKEARTADSDVVHAEVVRNMMLWEEGRRESSGDGQTTSRCNSLSKKVRGDFM